jgi:hypothetical protein
LRNIAVFVAGILCFGRTFAQDYDPAVAAWINRVDIDTLTSFVRILSGEDSVRIFDSTVLIKQRTGVPGGELAADYIRQTFGEYGLLAYDHVYRSTGRNVIAIQPGTVHPERQFIVCAHYDAVTDYCADDNASGTAAVLEAARILSSETFPYTIVYAAFDEEELGLIGSHYYAAQAAADGADIRGVLNLDMLSWDSNGDGLCDIHARDIGPTVSLAELFVRVDSVYDLPVVPVIRNPGTTSSDHSSFWGQGYGAILLIEGYYAGDFIPYYHSALDRVDKMNSAYFLGMAQAAVGAISTLARRGLQSPTAVDVGPNWSIVSLPSQTETDSAAALFPGAVTAAFEYSADSGYRARERLIAGKGYWMKFDTARTVVISGVPFAAETVDVAPGWNLVGSSSGTLDPATIASIPEGLVTSEFFGYRDGYQTADSIVPGRGYWVKTANGGKLLLPGAIPAGQAGTTGRIMIVATSERPPEPPEGVGIRPAAGVPSAFVLEQNYPNPFNPSTRIDYRLPGGAAVRIVVSNVLGEEVRTLVDEYQPAGVKSVVLDASDLPGGVYICAMRAAGFTASRKLLLMK